jgi:D-lactate dehydrogenase
VLVRRRADFTAHASLSAYGRLPEELMMTDPAASSLIPRLEAIVGQSHVLVGTREQQRYTRGYRFGGGDVAAVVRPGSLVELWRVFKLCVEHDHIIVMQAANTGLNGGSTPYGAGYDRPIVLINGLRIDRIDLLGEGKQALCFPGSKLHSLEKALAPIDREPHSVIGSTTVGATVIGGIANNSGGALLRRGPAFTQLSLYARADEEGRPQLVNELGINLGNDPEAILGRLDRGDYSDTDVVWDPSKLASDPDYATIVRQVDKNTPARFNNDRRLLSGASGSAGKVCVFAVRVDTFEKTSGETVFCVGTQDHAVLTRFRRHIMQSFQSLPLACEYLHQEGHQLAVAYGKDLYLFLKYFGANRIKTTYAAKSWFDGLTDKFGMGRAVSDRILQFLSRLLPNHLPPRFAAFARQFEHQVYVRVDRAAEAEMRAYVQRLAVEGEAKFLECTPDEAAAAFRHRYAMGGASVRFRAVHSGTVEDLVALDVAFPRNTEDWRDNVPAEIMQDIVRRFPCGHFLCHTFHYDYALKKGANWHDMEAALIKHFKARGAEVPSEHNVGHLYSAGEALVAHYRALDPTNSMNPGIGLTSKRKYWQ